MTKIIKTSNFTRRDILAMSAALGATAISTRVLPLAKS